MPHTPNRPLARVLKASILFALLAAIIVTLAPRSAHPPQRVSATAPPVVYTGPTTDPTTDIGAAVEQAQLAAWYEWASNLPVEQPRPRRRAPVEGNLGAQQAQADGDRFDRLAQCESHGNPAAVSPGGKYRGAFQFSLTSWHSAGMDGDPIDYDYATQKQTAMHWAGVTTPSSQWPVCWPRSA